MALDPLTSGLIGAAAGWAGQWFLIDRPVLRKDPGGAAASDDWKSKFDALKADVDARASTTADAEDWKGKYHALKADFDAKLAAPVDAEDWKGKYEALKADFDAKLGASADAGDLQAKLNDCVAERISLQEELEQQKAELAASQEAFGSAKTELAGMRAAAGDVRDDLEIIDGIGPVFERKLYDAGVFTFRQLSEMTPEAIAAIINPQKWQKIEPDKWIAEAASRVHG